MILQNWQLTRPWFTKCRHFTHQALMNCGSPYIFVLVLLLLLLKATDKTHHHNTMNSRLLSLCSILLLLFICFFASIVDAAATNYKFNQQNVLSYDEDETDIDDAYMLSSHGDHHPQNHNHHTHHQQEPKFECIASCEHYTVQDKQLCSCEANKDAGVGHNLRSSHDGKCIDNDSVKYEGKYLAKALIANVVQVCRKQGCVCSAN